MVYSPSGALALAISAKVSLAIVVTIAGTAVISLFLSTRVFFPLEL
jgi:hypothetical protein